MNMASTRSHCIFTIHISSREIGGDIIRKSKLHLVDLAGYVFILYCKSKFVLVVKTLNTSYNFVDKCFSYI